MDGGLTSFHLFQDHYVKEENILFVSLIAAETGGQKLVV